MDFDEIINDLATHFKSVYVTNFDLIHHSARGDPLSYSKKFYQTIAMSDLKQIDFPNSLHLSLQRLNLNVTMFILKKKS